MPLPWESIVMTGGVVSSVPNDNAFEAVFGFHAISMKLPLSTDTLTAPVDTIGVRIKLYPVELVWVKPLSVAFVGMISLIVKPLTVSEMIAFMETAHEILLGAVVVSNMVGRVISSVPVRIMPDAITWLVIPPE